MYTPPPCWRALRGGIMWRTKRTQQPTALVSVWPSGPNAPVRSLHCWMPTYSLALRRRHLAVAVALSHRVSASPWHLVRASITSRDSHPNHRWRRNDAQVGWWIFSVGTGVSWHFLTKNLTELIAKEIKPSFTCGERWWWFRTMTSNCNISLGGRITTAGDPVIHSPAPLPPSMEYAAPAGELVCVRLPPLPSTLISPMRNWTGAWVGVRRSPANRRTTLRSACTGNVSRRKNETNALGWADNVQT